MIDPGVAVCSGRGMFIKSPENGLTVRQGFPDLRVRMKAPQLAPCPSIERWSRSVTHSGESRKGSSLLAEDRIESTEQSAGLSLLGAGGAIDSETKEEFIARVKQSLGVEKKR